MSDSLADLGPATHYRFAFDAGRCIACHSCEVACDQQNAHQGPLAWRLVGELEGGAFPFVKRLNISMACNHCLEPACLLGCPTNAYVKLDNGIVAHLAGRCLGCQYCIWNCPYQAPSFDPERRIVTKCDLCRPRLEVGHQPACVEACPTQALTIEMVDPKAWRADHRLADAPGLPSADLTLSTTRLTLPDGLPPDLMEAHRAPDTLEHPHWSLIAFTVGTQVAVGAASQAVLTGASLLGAGLVAAGASLGALAHLGHPERAWRAVANLRRSWLSREVLLLTAFTALALVIGGARLIDPGEAGVVNLATAAALTCGWAGLYSSARLYRVPSRPAWDSWRTIATFLATALMLGPPAGAVLYPTAATDHLALYGLALGAPIQLGLLLAALATRHRPSTGRTASLDLLAGRLRGRLAVRLLSLALLGVVGLAGSRATSSGLIDWLFLLGLGSEVLGRYLFFVSVVPTSQPRPFVPDRPLIVSGTR
jgi:Fe-S-cluster-containing dehydrogenase component/DMSO reductase anchor subunit